ncbi:hypothetical protein M6D93_09325 [Jatrophihabitans telluris]|uniref:ATP-grasp domain-containing protein n=1 Tax=Jatrophihabitans telluris TaxID=2038343 RepID=A0ABY4R3Y1_9ACTN|nr:hypothetical protein [Jatrophihabitans telluris]UQX90182.1 hypothetical protein M6D93_09325 [Jatrophihabitans telluris]
MTGHICIATCDELLPDGHEGDFPLIAALTERGLEVSVASWSDPTVDWDDFDLTVIRSTWDYTARREDFLSWLRRVPNLHNPASVVVPNTDKRYLAELIAAGLPVVPTTFADPGEPVTFPTVGQFVVKPSVGAGSRGAGRFDASGPGELDRAAAHAAALHAEGRTVLVQPYLSAVDTEGETAQIFIDGTFSHAIRKGRMLAEGAGFAADAPGLFIEENISARVPGEQERIAADRILAHLAASRPLLYARIDLLPGPDGPLLVEAELTEPSLFFEFAPEAADVMADVIVARAGAAG